MLPFPLTPSKLLTENDDVYTEMKILERLWNVRDINRKLEFFSIRNINRILGFSSSLTSIFFFLFSLLCYSSTTTMPKDKEIEQPNRTTTKPILSLNLRLTSLLHHTKPLADPLTLPLQPHLTTIAKHMPSITAGKCEPLHSHHHISTSSILATTSHHRCNHHQHSQPTTMAVLSCAPSTIAICALSCEPPSLLCLCPAKTTVSPTLNHRTTAELVNPVPISPPESASSTTTSNHASAYINCQHSLITLLPWIAGISVGQSSVGPSILLHPCTIAAKKGDEEEESRGKKILMSIYVPNGRKP